MEINVKDRLKSSRGQKRVKEIRGGNAMRIIRKRTRKRRRRRRWRRRRRRGNKITTRERGKKKMRLFVLSFFILFFCVRVSIAFKKSSSVFRFFFLSARVREIED